MKTSIGFTFDRVRHDVAKDLHVVVSLTAPKLEVAKKRAPVCIVPCIDVSGSMAGRKLEYAKQSVMKLIDHLQPGDYCGLVTFESSVCGVAEPSEMTQARKDDLKKRVGELVPLGGTNFAGGMVQALSYLAKTDLKGGTILRVIMFTDGQANEGVHDAYGLEKLLKANIGRASLSAFGYGDDCDQALLAALAKEGQGNYAYIKNPDQALTAFAKELGGLLSTYAQNIVIDLVPHNGHEFTDVVSDVDSETDGKKVKIRLRDILSEEVRHVVVGLKLSPQTKALPRPMNVVDGVVEYDLLNDQGVLEHRKEELKGKLEFVKAGEEQDKPTAEIDKIVAQAQVVRQQIEAESLANKGQYDQASFLMSNLAADVQARGFAGLGSVALKSSGNYSSQHAYCSSAGYRSSMTKGLSRGYGLSMCDEDAGVDLRGLGVAMDNSVQSSTVGSFGGPGSFGGSESFGSSGSGDVPSVVAGSFLIPPVLPISKPSGKVSGNSKAYDASKAAKSAAGGLAKKRSKRW